MSEPNIMKPFDKSKCVKETSLSYLPICVYMYVFFTITF